MNMNNKSIKLQIRPPIKEDAAAILEYLKIVGGETDNLTFGPEGHPNTIEQEERFIESIGKDDNVIMLLGLVGEQIGAIGSLFGSPRPKLRHSVELGISVKRAYWHMGVATSIIKSMIKWAKEKDHIIQVTLSVVFDNYNAIALYHKLGFVDTGRHARQIKVNDEYKDTIIMALSLK